MYDSKKSVRKQVSNFQLKNFRQIRRPSTSDGDPFQIGSWNIQRASAVISQKRDDVFRRKVVGTAPAHFIRPMAWRETGCFFEIFKKRFGELMIGFSINWSVFSVRFPCESWRGPGRWIFQSDELDAPTVSSIIDVSRSSSIIEVWSVSFVSNLTESNLNARKDLIQTGFPPTLEFLNVREKSGN